MPGELTKLWQVEHPYYCNQGNYYSQECGSHHPRWQDFLESEGDSDLNYNLLFRWDWEAPRDEDAPGSPIKWVGDENYRDCILLLFFMGQRKGLYRYVTVDVCRADEPAVRSFLQTRWDHLQMLWSPFVAGCLPQPEQPGETL